MKKTKLRKGDKVKIISGNYKGSFSSISKINKKNGKIYLDDIVRKKYDFSSLENKKNMKKKNIMIPIDLSNVIYWLEKNKVTTKLTFKNIKGKKERISRKYNNDDILKK